MKFNGITKKGREYLAKVQAENLPIQFSKIKIGDGRLDDYDDPTELTALRNLKVELGILSKTQEAETVTLSTNIDNVSLAQGYYPREIGVFVQDGDRELLYYYMNDGEETSWIPPEADGPFKIELKINLIVSNAQSIVVQNSGKDLYITKKYLEENYTKNGGSNNNASQIEDRVTAAVGGLAGMFPLSQATANNIYYCEGNKKFYVCKSNYDGTRISVPNMNFEELSIFENRKRLENLFTTEGVIKMANGYGIAIKTKISGFKNYIDFNDIFKSINFALVTPWNDFQNEEAIPIFQEIQQDKVLIKGYFPKANIYRKYSTITNQDTCPCMCLAYGKLK